MYIKILLNCILNINVSVSNTCIYSFAFDT